MPTISCIVPVWNGEAYLQQALDSIFAQSLPPDEVIVVDDGSTDASAAIAERNAPRVTLIRQPHLNAAAARNRGIAAARGALIAFLDADDLWLEHKLARQVAAIAAEAADCCFTLIDSLIEPGSGAIVPEGLKEARVGRIASTFLGRAAMIARVGPLDESMAVRAEYDWFARFGDAGVTVAIVHETLARRRLHDRNHSRTSAAAATDAAFELIARRRGRDHRAG